MTDHKRSKFCEKSHGKLSLVGYSGKINYDRRLQPLRMTTRYKRRLEEEEHARIEKVGQKSELSEKYNNTAQVIRSLQKKNENDVNESLIRELSNEMEILRKDILQLKSDCSLSGVNGINANVVFQNFETRIVHRRSNKNHSAMKRKRSATENVPHNAKLITDKLDKQMSLFDQGIHHGTTVQMNTVLKEETNIGHAVADTKKMDFVCEKEETTKASRNHEFGAKNSVSKSVKTQVLVRDRNLNVRPIDVNLSSSGADLMQALCTEFGDEISSCGRFFGSAKLNFTTSLKDQGILHGSTIELNVSLHGGMESEHRSRGDAAINRSEASGKPEKWTKQQVTEWINSICVEYELDETEVIDLKKANGKGLDMLDKDDWLRRSPTQGDLFYNLWKKLKTAKSSVVEETQKHEGNRVVVEEKKTVIAVKEKPFSGEPDGKKSHQSESKVSRRVMFSKAKDFEALEYVTVRQLVDKVVPVPGDGQIFSIRGICGAESVRTGETFSMILSPEQVHDSSDVAGVRIEIKTNTKNKLLQRNFVKKFLKKIKPGTEVAVTGCVSKCVIGSDPANVIFRLVLDSEEHSLVYSENKRLPTILEELPKEMNSNFELFEAQVDGIFLKTNNVINKTNRRVFCSETASHEQLQKYAVAFKNSFDGDIFVGVETNGVVSGVELVQGDLAKWREKMAKLIGEILPGTDEQVSFCKNYDEAVIKIGKECFISIMNLGNNRGLIWIHIPKGKEKVYFSKPKDVTSFVRVGAQTKRMSNYKELFSLLESLNYRIIGPKQEFTQVYENALSSMHDDHAYKLFKRKKAEGPQLEFKMIFSHNPVKKIVEEYVAEYCCSFLNSCPTGTIYFGVEEDDITKEGVFVGVVITDEQRKQLLQKSIKCLEKFYPPVDPSKISITFKKVTVPLNAVLKFHDGEDSGKVVLLRCSGEEVANKNWCKFINLKMPDISARVIRFDSESFCIVTENVAAESDKFFSVVEEFQRRNSGKCSLKSVEESELVKVLAHLCVVKIAVEQSEYPIHLTKPMDTHIFTSNGELACLAPEELVRRFEMKHDFDIDMFLSDVNNFDAAGNSYIMISSPFDLPKVEQDLYGLVIPKWTLAVDFDQDPKVEGHFFHLFEKLHDRYHKERDRCLVTPQSDSLDLNADHGVCWLAARGHRDIADSLSQESEGKNTWNITHRKKINTLLSEELTRNVMPSKIHVIVFWDEGWENLSYSLTLVLADLLSICDNTSVTFVCSTPKAHADIDKDVKRLKENCTITNDSGVHIAPLHVLAKHLAVSLPGTFRPEDKYQVPKKAYTENTSLVTVPTELPQRLRQNIHGRLRIMYINKCSKIDEKTLQEERMKFYTGSQITMLGLRGNIGIKREKLLELEQAFKDLLNDKKSRVSLIKVKADRGAGTTTMCLQFLYQYHEKIPCAQLVEIHRDLLSFIEKINQITNLPLLVLVDEEVGNLQDFIDFKKEAENRRTVNIIFLLVEPVQLPEKPSSVGRSGKIRRLRRIGDSSLYGTSYYKEIKLKSELEKGEFEKLTLELLKICPDEAKEKVSNLKDRAMFDNSRYVRRFAHFSLTAFGKEFSGISDYVRFRLHLANDLQKDMLAFLSLTHVYTGYKLPASALARLLNKDKVSMRSEFSNDYLQEMLSPPANETDLRRISFLEVAREILAQLSEDYVEEENMGNNYWRYIKHIAVKMARDVLSVNIGSSKIDRLTRKLFIISEYESEKFSSLIRSMRNEECADVARDTLHELVEVFKKHHSFRAHVLAHLAKYYMIEYKDYESAKPRIEEAVMSLPDDPLLYHIHGDIIRHHIEKLKNEETVNMREIVRLAIESSGCFQEVRERRPHMNHGYASDALVQITVMQASIKSVSSVKLVKENYGFVEYLIEMINRAKNDKKLDEQEQYLLTLISSAYEYLNESGIEYEYKDKLKRKFNECIPNITEIKNLCEILQTEKKNFSGRKAWIDEVINRTYSLFLVLEIENYKNMSPEDFESRIKAIEERGFNEDSMKYWFRYVRKIREVPSLLEVEKKVKQWIWHSKKDNKISPHAEFYNYVVAILIAIKDPKDRQKMEKAAELVSKQQRYKNTTNDRRYIPQTLEWLCPKAGSHVNSIDSLLHSDDLLKENSMKGKEIPLKDKFESCLRKRNVPRLEGVVKRIKSDWQGTITFHSYIDVHFVPQSIRTSKPAIGDTVSFHLSFDWHGPRAWSVTRIADSNSYKKSGYESGDTDEGDEDAQDQELFEVPSPLWCRHVEENDHEEKRWKNYVGQRMTGVVSKLRFETMCGFFSHPDVEGELYFNLNDCHLHLTHQFTILKFCVTNDVNGKMRAVEIGTAKHSEIDSKVVNYRDLLAREFKKSNRKTHEGEHEKNGGWENPRRRQWRKTNTKTYQAEDYEVCGWGNPPQRLDHFPPRFEPTYTTGYINRFFGDRGYGFINADGLKDRVFFHRDQLMPGVNPSPDTRVMFWLARNEEGFIAKNIDTQDGNGWQKYPFR